jgi:hypothetical protein
MPRCHLKSEIPHSVRNRELKEQVILKYYVTSGTDEEHGAVSLPYTPPRCQRTRFDTINKNELDSAWMLSNEICTKTGQDTSATHIGFRGSRQWPTGSVFSSTVWRFRAILDLISFPPLLLFRQQKFPAPGPHLLLSFTISWSHPEFRQ